MDRKQLRRLQKLCTVISIGLLIAAFAVKSTDKDAACFVLPLLALVILDGWISSRITKQNKAETARRPIIREQAVVESCSIRHKYFCYGSKGIMHSDTHWIVAFQTRKHGRVTLSVPRDVYLIVAEGVHGSLDYQGSRFLRFHAE